MPGQAQPVALSPTNCKSIILLYNVFLGFIIIYLELPVNIEEKKARLPKQEAVMHHVSLEIYKSNRDIRAGPNIERQPSILIHSLIYSLGLQYIMAVFVWSEASIG